MKVTPQELAQLQKIERLFAEINQIYSGFNEDTRFGLNHLHEWESSFEFCMKEGLEAAKDAVEQCTKDSQSLLDEFKEYCYEKSEEAGTRYNKQYLDRFMVVDEMWDSDRTDCDLFAYVAEYTIDEHPEWFEDCETIEDCEDIILGDAKDEISFDRFVDGERANLSYGEANLKGAVIIEVGSIGRWNGSLYGLNILDVETIGELLHSDCEQWMCYVDKATGEFCKMESHHNGRNYYEYRELICDRDEFEDLLEEAEPGEMAELVSKYSKSIGPRVANVYGWDLETAAAIEDALQDLIDKGCSLEQAANFRQMIILDGISIEEAKEKVYMSENEKKAGSLDEKICLDAQISVAQEKVADKRNGDLKDRMVDKKTKEVDM